jgi:hypothetical protein
MKTSLRLQSLLAVSAIVSAFFVSGLVPARGQVPGAPGGPQSRFMPPPGPATFALGLQTRVTDTGMLVVGHAINSVGRALGIERGDTIITVDGQQVGQVANRLVDLDQTLQYTINRQGSAVILIKNGRDGRLLNVGVRREQFAMAAPVTPPPVTAPPAMARHVPPPVVDPVVGQIRQVKKWYLEYLGRDASPQEVGGWETQLRQGRPIEGIRNELLAGTEYYRRNGNDEAKFIGALFRDLVRRNPVPPEGGNWLTRFKQLKADRTRLIEALRAHYGV